MDLNLENGYQSSEIDISRKFKPGQVQATPSRGVSAEDDSVHAEIWEALPSLHLPCVNSGTLCFCDSIMSFTLCNS